MKSVDLRISYIATFIALLALFFSILDHYQNRKHNKKTVLPILIAEVDEIDSKYGIFISNQGYGPAIIDTCIVSYDDDVITGVSIWHEVFIKHFTTPPSFVLEDNEISSRTVIKAGETKLLWGAKSSELLGNRHLLDNAIDKISIQVYYRSIYDDKSKMDF